MLRSAQAQELAAPSEESGEAAHLTKPSKSPVVSLRPRQIPALTGLRFLVAMLVVIHHFGPYTVHFASSGTLRVCQLVERNLLYTGMVGVDLFFVLSGFILAYVYLDGQGAMRSTRRAFWAARVARIYPVYLCAWLVAAAVLLIHQVRPPSLFFIATSLALVQKWIPGGIADWNPPAWSLSVEVFFYLLFPLLARTFTRLSFCTRLCICTALWATTVALACGYLAVHPQGLVGASWRALLDYPVIYLPTFLTGVVLGQLYFSGHRFALPIRPGVAAAMTLGTAVAVLTAVPWSFGPLYHIALTPLFASLVYTTAHSTGRAAQALGSRYMVLLGEASYGIYILHWPLWMLLTHYIPAPAVDTPARLEFFLAYASATVIVSVIVLRCIEQPARRAIRYALLAGPWWRLEARSRW